MVTEQSRLQLELQRQSPEASAAIEEAVVGWTTRCEQLQEQLDESAAAAAASDSRTKKAESIADSAISSQAATRENSAGLEESNAQLSRKLTNAEHQLQHQSEQVGELQAEHQRQLASVEEERLVDERDWNKALDEAEAKEAIALAEAAAAEQECEEHKAQLLQQLKETQAAAEVLEERLREFDDVAAAAAAAAEAEHDRDKANLQRQLGLQSERLKKSARDLRATNTKLKEAEGSLQENEAELNAAAKELATAREDHASSAGEMTAHIDRLLLLVEQLKKSAAAASRESDQKQEVHQSVVSALEKQMAQLRSARSSAEEQRAAVSEELNSLRRESDVSERRLEKLQANQVHLQATCAAECAQVREAAHASRVELQSECARLQVECEQLQGATRPCTTCGGGDGQDPEDDCPAELAATHERLRLAEDFITELETAYDSLRDLN